LEFFSKGAVFINPAHDITIEIPEGSVDDQAQLKVGVTAYGPLATRITGHNRHSG
jgi:hypothetical protein